jgi:hypothetical protein
VSEERSTRVARRIRRRLVVGLLTGGLLGALASAVVGVVVSSPGALGFRLIVVAATIFCAMLGALIGGYSSLESPDPGREPSDSTRPISAHTGLTREEHSRTGRER